MSGIATRNAARAAAVAPTSVASNDDSWIAGSFGNRACFVSGGIRTIAVV